MRLPQHITLLILFMTALFLVATPTMAVIVQGTLQITEYVEGVQADTTTTPPTPVKRGKWVITIAFNVPLNPKLKKEYVYRYGELGVFEGAIGDEFIFEEIDASTYTITRYGAEDGSDTPAFIRMSLYRFLEELDTTIDNSREGRTDINPDNPGRKIELRMARTSFPPYTYMIIGRHSLANNELAPKNVNTRLAFNNQSIYPTMPQSAEVLTNSLAEQATMPIRRSPWDNHVDDVSTIPDLYAHFQEGQRGSIGVTVNHEFLNEIDEPNAKKILITEVMWARDESQVGSPGHTREQWIEIYNNTTLPIWPGHIRVFFEPYPVGSPPSENKYTDRLSTYPSYTTVWDIDGKGQHGNSQAGSQREFISMARKDLTKDGWDPNNWEASTELFYPNYRGTPGRDNYYANLPGARNNPTAASVPKSPIIINEVGNNSDDALDWIELRNVSGGNVNIKNWRINRTTGTDFNEHNVVQFANKDTVIPPGEVLLIVNRDPENTPLAAGQDIREGDRANQQYGAGPHKYLNTAEDGRNLHIPNMDQGYLILRNHGDNKFRGGRKQIVDVVGYSRVTRNTIQEANGAKEPEVGQYWVTDAWPLNGHSGNNYRAHNAKDSNNNNASLDPNADFRNGTVWARNGTANGWRKGGGSHAGYVGGIGYDPNVTHDKANGTPGYHNVVKGKTGDITDGGLIISELMLTTDNGRYPQWIELQNTSRTQGIDLAADGSDPKTGWQMIIENHNSGSWAANNRPLVATINLRDFANIRYIPPNQTVLIVSRTSRNSLGGNRNFPSHRIASVYGTPAARSALGPKNSKDDMLNVEGGFYIKIVDGDGNVSDEIGNLDGKAADLRGGIPLDDPYSWNWPTEMTADGLRTSLIRLKDNTLRGVLGESSGTAGTPRTGVPDRSVDGDNTGMVLPLGVDHNQRGNGMIVMGMDEMMSPLMVPAKYAGAAWIHAVDTALAEARNTWYGSNVDFGTPGHTTGSPLPVSLSFFRPTLEDGKIVIRWTTESELDNAGFNILRSDTRDGEFTQVNEQMIQGNGTIGERSTYKWLDTTAKPNAVYYYQIEDVSFAGERNTLATTKMKGLVSAKNKLTTTWSDLKSQN